MEQTLYNILVINEKGVLDRIAGIMRRYGGNISSIMALETETPGKSLITVAIESAYVDELVEEKINALDCVQEISYCDPKQYSYSQMFVARGPEELLSAHTKDAVKSELLGEVLTAYWIGTPQEIGTARKRIEDIDKAGEISLVVTGVVALGR